MSKNPNSHLPRSTNLNLIPRKVQRLGASSLIVTIPKEWARRNNVDVGDVVSLIDAGDRLILLPGDSSKEVAVEFDGRHKRVVKHIGRLTLCGFIFGHDRITVESPRMGTTREIMERIERVLSILPYIYVQGDGKRVILDLNAPGEDPWSALHSLGRSTVDFLEKLSEYLKGRASLTAGDVEAMHLDLMRKNYRLLRSINKNEARGGLETIMNKYFFLYSSFLGLAVEALYSLSRDIVRLRDRLSEDEVERLSFLMQLLEVIVATISSRLEPMSVKKIEETYWKIKTILELENSIEEIMDKSTPAYAYLLGKIIDVARILELAGSVMVCYMITQKYSVWGNGRSEGGNANSRGGK